jgi:6-pyruvoyl-tetrahydropterin synthase
LGELTWTRRYSFQSVHSLNSTVLRERVHGHQYLLEVTFAGDVDEADQIVRGEVLSLLHGRELSFLEPATGEHIVDWIHAQLLKTRMSPRLKAVALQETRKNSFISARSELRYV